MTIHKACAAPMHSGSSAMATNIFTHLGTRPEFRKRGGIQAFALRREHPGTVLGRRLEWYSNGRLESRPNPQTGMSALRSAGFPVPCRGKCQDEPAAVLLRTICFQNTSHQKLSLFNAAILT